MRLSVVKRLFWRGNRNSHTVIRAMRPTFFLGLLLSIVCSVNTKQYREYEIQVHAAKTEKADTYQCIAIPIDELAGRYVVGYRVNASIDYVHHLAISFCGRYRSNTTTWDCYNQQGSICKGATKDLVGYNGGGMGNNNVLYMYPEDVGIKIGDDTGFYNLIVQFHFKEPMKDPSTPASLTLFLAEEASMRYNRFVTAQSGYIPAKSSAFSAETACTWKGVEVYPYSFDTHTHDRGYYVEGFRIRNGTWTLIGKGGPHIIDGKIQNDEETFSLVPGDIIATRCVFRNNDDVDVHMGLDHANEMCIYGIKFKYRPEHEMVYYRAPICRTDIQSFDWCSKKETKSRCHRRNN